MNTSAIIKKLGQLSKNEENYLLGKRSPYLDELEYIELDQKKIAFIAYEKLPNKKHPYLEIKRHSRFHPWPVHCHDWVEINYLVQGSCQQTINGKSYTIQKGDLILLDSMTPHTIAPLSEEDILLDICISKHYLTTNFFNRFSNNSLVLNFFIDSISNDVDTNRFILFKNGSERLTDFMLMFITEWENPSIAFMDVIDSLFAAIIAELVNLHENSISSVKYARASKIPTMLKYLEDNYQEGKLSVMAEHFAMNPNYLSSYLKKHTGYSYQQLLQQQRINVAKNMLIHTNYSTSEISHQVGYENVHFFYNKFNELTGYTPGNFRKQLPMIKD